MATPPAPVSISFVNRSIPGIVEFGSPQHLQRIELEAIRDRIFRIEQNQDANWKADYWAFFENKGMLKGDATPEERGE